MLGTISLGVKQEYLYNHKHLFNHMEQKDHPWIGIDAIILNENKTKILLIKRGSKAYHGMWGFVSGVVDWGGRN